MPRLRLRDNVHIGIEYEDRTRFGSPVGGRPDQGVREVFQPLLDYVEAYGYVAMVREAPALLAEVVRGEIFNHITEPDGAGAWRVKPEILFPDPAQARPFAVGLVREDTDRHVRAELPAAYWPSVHALLAQLSGSGCDPEAAELHPNVRAMLQGMIDEELVEDADAAAPPDPRLAEAGLTFLGHNTVVVRSQTARLIVDPFLFAGSAAFPAGYQPLQLRELGAIDAVLITHSHPDHFDPSTLLRFPLETRLIVPHVERETILAIAMERRLRELGFTHITVMDWGESTLVGDIEVHALPFYGEQATDGEVLHPAIRNAGNTYLVRTPAFSAAFLADSGRDGQGDVRDVATRTRARLGPVDIVFSGFRGWLTYPAQYLFSSVARFLLFVPPSQWSARQQIMTTPDEALNIAERWGARCLAPYADGGAPWHWRIGLGPDLSDPTAEMAAFDPFPERVLEAAAGRSLSPDRLPLGSPVQTLLLRPGDSLTGLPAEPTVLRLPCHTWPYAEPGGPDGSALAAEPVGTRDA